MGGGLPRHPTPDTQHSGGAMSEEITSVWTYVLVTLVAIVLAAESIGSAQLDLGGLNVVANLGVAVVTTCMIVTFFMEIRLAGGLLRLAAAGGVLWLGILLVGTLDD